MSKKARLILMISLSLVACVRAASSINSIPSAAASSVSLYDLSAETIDGRNVSLSEYRGKVALVVNTTSRCGTTPQFGDLQQLYQRYRSRGLVVLGFPTHDFGGLKSETNEEISHFCTREYGVTFPLFKPGHVRGAERQRVYSFLTENCEEKLQGEVIYNFEKFLIDRRGHVRARFGSFTGPLDSALTSQLENLLAEPDGI